MNTTVETIELHIIIEVRFKYCVFDLSGAFPFEFRYSLARAWPTAKDNPPDPLPSRYIDRPLIIQIQNSLLDVGYALKYGHLKIFDKDNGGAPIDFSAIDLQQSCEPEYVSLESGASSVVRWKERLYELSTKIDPSSSIGRKFEPNHRYRLRITRDSDDFPVQKSILGGKHHGQNNCVDIDPQQGPSENLRLRKSIKLGGYDDFRTVSSLRQPPQVNVRLSTNPIDPKISHGSSFELKAEITNKSDHAIVVKSKGQQNYIAPQLRIGSSTDDRPRITCPRSTSDERRLPKSPLTNIHRSNLSIINLSSGEEIIAPYKEVCSVPVGRPTRQASRKIYRDNFTTLEPNVPLIKEDILESIYPRCMQLEPGTYQLTLVPLGAVWFWGSVQEIFGDGDSIVEYPWPPSETLPVSLASEDKIMFSVE